jgi:hypothetical protein
VDESSTSHFDFGRIADRYDAWYAYVAFCDQDFDIPAAGLIRDLPECSSFMELPFTVHFKNGRVAAATTSVQRKAEIEEILNATFGKPAEMTKG